MLIGSSPSETICVMLSSGLGLSNACSASALALLTALDVQAVREVGFLYVLVPVGVTTAAMVALAVIYNRLTGRMYPFRQAGSTPQRPARQSRLGFSNEELEELLARFNQSANLGAVDLARLLAAAEKEAAMRRFEGTTCADIMTPEVITALPDAPFAEVARRFLAHAATSLPVVDVDGRLLGLILPTDLLEPALGTAQSELTAADLMRTDRESVAASVPVGALLDMLSHQAVQVLPVTRDGRLVGILTRSDIIALLLRTPRRRRRAT